MSKKKPDKPHGESDGSWSAKPETGKHASRDNSDSTLDQRSGQVRSRPGEYTILGPRGGKLAEKLGKSSHSIPPGPPPRARLEIVETPSPVLGKGRSVGKPTRRSPHPHTGFDAERAAYALLKPELLKTSLGRFVVLVGDQMIGPFDDFRSAHIAGRHHFGPGPLYIKEVLAEDRVDYIPCLS